MLLKLEGRKLKLQLRRKLEQNKCWIESSVGLFVCHDSNPAGSIASFGSRQSELRNKKSVCFSLSLPRSVYISRLESVL